MDNTFRGRSLKQSIDWKLIIIYLLLVLIGWVNIYASVHSAEPSSIFDWSVRSGKQFVWILTALSIAGLIMFIIPPRIWESSAIPLYIIVFVLLIAVIFVGQDIKGSRSWFKFGPVSFQPAEISKITTSLLLATVMSRDGFKLSKISDFLTVAMIIGLPMLAILGEKETGSALIYVGFIFVLYREGLSGWFLAAIGMCILTFILTLTKSAYVAALVLAGIIALCNALNSKKPFIRCLILAAVLTVMALIPWLWGSIPEEAAGGLFASIQPIWILLGLIALSIPYIAVKSFRERNNFGLISILAFFAGLILIFSSEFIFNNVLQDHQRLRIEVLLGMKEDLAGVGYNVNQSMIAIGSGGLFGKGFLGGTQTTYGFVPEQSTDFIFCTVGEEWGFIGCLVVISLYVMLIWQLMNDAEKCREHFTRTYGYCVASCLFMHLLINVGMTIGLMPVIGIPLPLMSYGGSSLWGFTILIFIFIALYHEEKKYF